MSEKEAIEFMENGHIKMACNDCGGCFLTDDERKERFKNFKEVVIKALMFWGKEKDIR